MQRAEHVPAFVLHRRDWQDNDSIVELLTAAHGRLSVFARGVRGASARLAGVLQPFAPLLVSWAGRGEAPRLIGAELDPGSAPAAAMPAARLMSAWYCTELVISLTARHDPQPLIYRCYSEALAGLRSRASQEKILRLFEKRLLDLLGYGLADLDEDRFEDDAELERVRTLLRSRLAQCLEGRSLRTRDVAQSMKALERSWQAAGR